MRKLGFILFCVLSFVACGTAAKDLFVFSDGSSYGLIDENGSIILSPRFIEVWSFDDGLAAVKSNNGLWGFIDKSGKTVIDPKYYAVHIFTEGLAGAMPEKKAGGEGRWGFIDQYGELIIPAIYQKVLTFYRGKTAVHVPGEKYSIVIDKTGRLIERLNYSILDNRMGSFSDGLASLYNTVTMKTGYIDENWRIAIEQIFDQSATDFNQGYAVVSKNVLPNMAWPKLFAFFDSDGRFVTEFRYEWTDGFSEGYAWVVESDAYLNDPALNKNRMGYASHFVDRDFKDPFPELNYSAIGRFSEGLAPVGITESKRVGFINITGEIAIAPKYFNARPFHGGMAAVQTSEGGKWGYIDKTGNLVIDAQWEEMQIRDFTSQIVEIVIPGKQCVGYMNKKGVFVWENCE